MKKFTVLVALALLAATGTGYAVTCAQDNVPAATLLIPYFKVSRGGITSAAEEIPAGGVDTMIAVTNVSRINLIAHVTVWNKYSWGVLDFNIPLTGYDVVTFRMRDILNGKLNANMSTQDPAIWGGTKDVCFATTANFPLLPGEIVPRPWTSLQYNAPFIRFANPDPVDGRNAISSYNTPAFSGSFRNKVWDSLDEGRDYTSMSSGGITQYVDVDNPSCYSNAWPSDQELTGDFTGYVTVDVTNYCTNLFPSDADFYVRDAIATVGWGNQGPNVLMGDYFYVDPASPGGNISGDAAIPLEFDARLDWTWEYVAVGDDSVWEGERTFYNRYATFTDPGTGYGTYSFVGDGREPLGWNYGFRYMASAAAGAQTWATIWRSDLYATYDSDILDYAYDPNLCAWGLNWSDYLNGYTAAEDFVPGLTIGLNNLSITYALYDEDEHSIAPTGGGPSGDPGSTAAFRNFVETQRVRIGALSSMNPQGYEFGWINWTFRQVAWSGNGFRQAWVGVNHSAEGQFVSVGHGATLIQNGVNDFTCPGDVFTQIGNTGNILVP